MKWPKAASGLTAIIAMLLAFLPAGCATVPRVDWNSRINHYTYDQALVELGPPDKQAQLSDGSVVAEWITRRGHTVRHVSPPPLYSPYHYYAPVYPSFYDTYSPDAYLRLIFGPDKRLRDWKKFYK